MICPPISRALVEANKVLLTSGRLKSCIFFRLPRQLDRLRSQPRGSFLFDFISAVLIYDLFHIHMSHDIYCCFIQKPTNFFTIVVSNNQC